MSSIASPSLASDRGLRRPMTAAPSGLAPGAASSAPTSSASSMTCSVIAATAPGTRM
jgi:hypothetical protein